MEYITYVSGGLLGDFIHQLSIIKENYIKYNKKGILYISNIGDNFRLGLQVAYDDTKEFILKQEYIHDYKIHNNEPYDINLSSWRNSPLLPITSWNNIFGKEYSVEWAKHKWIDVSINDLFVDKIIITYSLNRWNNSYDYNSLFNRFNIDEIMFVGLQDNEYNTFIQNTQLNIPFYKCTTLYELLIAINSCKLFIGNLSSPLAFAYAVHKKSIAILPDSTDRNRIGDRINVIGLDKYLNFPIEYIL